MCSGCARGARRRIPRRGPPARSRSGGQVRQRAQQQVGAALPGVAGLQLLQRHQVVEGDVGEPGRDAERRQGADSQRVLLAGGLLVEPVQDRVHARFDAEQHPPQARAPGSRHIRGPPRVPAGPSSRRATWSTRQLDSQRNPASCTTRATSSARPPASLSRPMNSSSTRYTVRETCGYRSKTRRICASIHGSRSGAAPAHIPLWPRGQKLQKFVHPGWSPAGQPVVHRRRQQVQISGRVGRGVAGQAWPCGGGESRAAAAAAPL